MQDILDITSYEYDFVWLHTYYSILIQWKDTKDTGLQQWCDWRGCKAVSFTPGKLVQKLSSNLAYISFFQYSFSGFH